jgi:hypothetical protein
VTDPKNVLESYFFDRKNHKKGKSDFFTLGIIKVNVGEMGHFFRKTHIKSTIYLMNKERVLFLGLLTGFQQ